MLVAKFPGAMSASDALTAGPANGRHEAHPRRRAAHPSPPADQRLAAREHGAVGQGRVAEKIRHLDQPGRISGLFLGNLAIVDWSVLKGAATIAGGVCVSQSDRETSSKRSLLNTSRNCKSVSPVFLT